MFLSAGIRLGPYEILAPVGAGGMGEVYRAKDTKLDREVAIKVLPAALAADPERLSRFEREAKVLASLNHPNIAQIYGVEESSNGRALVMELVPGHTLKGPLPLEDALRIAEQIAEALEAAHDKGIIHRDLKPANIMITPQGVVKVLDFGLAAVPHPSEENAADPSHSPTFTMRATEAGMILGTAAYMAPEQAAGRAVDKRTDIWAFGVVLWEMLTGQHLFTGESVAHILADVLRAPIDLDKLPKETPRSVRELLKRCLDRNVKSRLRDIGEARIAIQDAGKQPEAAPVEARASRLTWMAWAVAGLAIVGAAGMGSIHFGQAPQPVRVVSSTLAPPDGAAFEFEGPMVPALSPDGTQIVFGAKSKDGKVQLWLRRLASPTAQPLPGTENAGSPFWSPDSRWVAFGQENKLKKVDSQGGPPVTVADLSSRFQGGSWSPEGVIVFCLQGSGQPLFRVSALGGSAVPATILEPGNNAASHRYPWFLPDGRHFLYSRVQLQNTPVQVGSLDEPGKPGKIVARADSNAVYSQGHLLFLRNNTLMVQPFAADRLETKGEPSPLAEDVTTVTTPSRKGLFTVSSNGLLVYQSGGARLVWKDRQGRLLTELGEPFHQRMRGFWLSPDSKHLAVEIPDASGAEDVWIYDTVRATSTRFTFDPARDRFPIWSSNGDAVYFSSNRQGHYDLFRKRSNGAEAEELLLAGATNKKPTSVSPDGKLLLFDRQGEKTKRDIWILPLATQSNPKQEPRVFLQTPFDERSALFSPDGRWIAYTSDESGRDEVYVVPFPGPGEKRQISSSGGRLGEWRRDGKELFHNTGDQLMAVEVTPHDGTIEVGHVEKLLTCPNGDCSFSADGQKVLVEEEVSASSPALILLQNWPALLRK